MAKEGTPESDELDVLADLVELYESKREMFGYPDPVDAIAFRMDQAGLTRRDMVPLLGSTARVAEVLSGKRAITMPMARALHQHLGIPAEVLLREPGGDSGAIDFLKFPLKELVKRGWIGDVPDLRANAEQLIRGLAANAGVQPAAIAALYRKNDHQRINAKTDRHALWAWCWRVMAEANEHPPDRAYAPGIVTPDFLSEVARLSPAEDGPTRARDFLRDHGIALEVVKHLPRTHLDGAALRLVEGRPVIGLTLRYDPHRQLLVHPAARTRPRRLATLARVTATPSSTTLRWRARRTANCTRRKRKPTTRQRRRSFRERNGMRAGCLRHRPGWR